MRSTRIPARSFRFLTHLVALSCVCILAACEEITGPEVEAAAPPAPTFSQSGTVNTLASLSSSLDDMTMWSLATLQDNTQRGSLAGVLSGLKGHLKSGNAALCQEDVTKARGILAALPDVQQVELGHVGLALDVVQQSLDGGSQ